MSIGSTGLSDWEFGRLLVKPKEACRLLATRLYELIAAGELEAFLDGRSRKITTSSIHQYIEQKLANETEPHQSSGRKKQSGSRGRRP